MTIEFTNATPPKGNSILSVSLALMAGAFFVIPTGLIILGYYATVPTGSLISPVPQGVISQQPIITQKPIIAEPQITPSISSPSATNVESNSVSKTAIIPANTQESEVKDASINENSQIFLLNRDGDKSLYTIKSKANGIMTLTSTSISNVDRQVDYQIINP